MAELWIDTKAVCRNYHYYARQGMVIPVLKEDGYGLGAEAVLALLVKQGASLFACARPEEALRLSGKEADILLLSCEYDRDILRTLAERNVILSLESLSQAREIQSIGLPVRVHLAVDTGFGRFGFPWEQAEQMKEVYRMEQLQVCGIFSHFRGSKAVQEQLGRFGRALETLRGYPTGLRHIASTAFADNPVCRFDAVRIGSGLTGWGGGVQAAAHLTARICTLRRLPRGSRLGYGNIRLRRDTEVAILDIGTGDGAFLQRGCGPRAWWQSRHSVVRVNGLAAPVLGPPGLTHTAVDVTGISCGAGSLVEVEQTPILISPGVSRRYLANYSEGS